MHHLPGYAGTSSVLAITLLHQLQQQLQDSQQQQRQQEQGQQPGQEVAEQQQPDLRLVGTLAHEVRLAGGVLWWVLQVLHAPPGRRLHS
jgi:hypothetical protein